MSVSDIVEKGGTYILDPSETTLTPDDFLAKFGNIVDSIGIVAKSEAGSAYYPSSTIKISSFWI